MTSWCFQYQLAPPWLNYSIYNCRVHSLIIMSIWDPNSNEVWPESSRLCWDDDIRKNNYCCVPQLKLQIIGIIIITKSCIADWLLLNWRKRYSAIYFFLIKVCEVSVNGNMFSISPSSSGWLIVRWNIIIYYLTARGWWGALLRLNGGRVAGLLTLSWVKLMLGFFTKILLTLSRWSVRVGVRGGRRTGLAVPDGGFMWEFSARAGSFCLWARRWYLLISDHWWWWWSARAGGAWVLRCLVMG